MIWCQSATGQVPGDTLKILFVGNSYTYYQNLPHIVSIISDSTSTKLITKKSTAGGANLKDHWDGERGLNTREMISNGTFDIVVLQDHSLGPIHAADQFEEYAGRFCQFIKDSGAKPYFYLTWAREKVPQHQEILTRRYRQVAAKNGAALVPVGAGWTLARNCVLKCFCILTTVVILQILVLI